MGSKGSQSTTQSYAANPTTANFASNVAQNGQNLPGPGAVPLQNVAGLTNYQNQAISGAAGLGQQNPANPYFTQGNQYVQQSAQPLSQTAQPIYNSMVQGIMPQIQNVFGQQQSQNNANLIQSAGGVGADRIAVGQGNLANQQGLALGQTLSGLQGQAYQTAAQQSQLQQGAGALSYAAGPAALQTQISGYGAENAAGTQQQQQQQNIYNSQFAQQQGQYQNPFQTLQAQQGTLGSLGSALQGTTTNTYPGPSQTATDVGLAETALGVIGAPFTGGASLGMVGTGLSQVGQGKGSYGGNVFSGMPSYGGGSPLTGDTYGGSASSPLPGLDASDYGWRGGRMNGKAAGGAIDNPYAVDQHYDDGGNVTGIDPLSSLRLMGQETADEKGYAAGGMPHFDDGGGVDITTDPATGVPFPTNTAQNTAVPPWAANATAAPPSAFPSYTGMQGGPALGGGAPTPFPAPPQPPPQAAQPLPPTGPAPGPPLPIAPAQPYQPQQQPIPAPPQYAPIYQQAGTQYGVDPTLLARQGAQESSFNPKATSSAGAQGIAQFMPDTAKQYGVDVTDPKSSINGQAHYMADLLKQFNGNQGLALAAYNWGPNKVAAWQAAGGDPSKVPEETKQYVQNITGKPIDEWVGGAEYAGSLPQTASAQQGDFNPYSFNNGQTQISISDNPGTADEQTDSRLAASPWTALMRAGLGTLAASGKRDARGLPMTGAAAIGAGGLEGLEQINEQQKIANQYNRMTPAQKTDLQLKAQQQQFEQKKPFPMGQTIGPLGLPVTQFGTMGPNGPVAVPLSAEATANAQGAALDDDAVKNIAQAYRGGNTAVIQGLGFGQLGALNRARVWNEISSELKASGADGTALNAAHANFMADSAGARTAAVREANIGTAVAEAQQTFPLALQASQALPRGSFTPFNAAEIAVKKGLSDPATIQYVTALRGAVTAYSQAMSRTGVNTVYAQTAAEDMLNQATGPEGIQAALEQMAKEMHAAEVAPGMVRDAFTARMGGKPASNAPPGQGAAPQGGGSPQQQAKAPAVTQNGWTYKLQADGSYNDPSPTKAP